MPEWLIWVSPVLFLSLFLLYRWYLLHATNLTDKQNQEEAQRVSFKSMKAQDFQTQWESGKNGMASQISDYQNNMIEMRLIFNKIADSIKKLPDLNGFPKLIDQLNSEKSALMKNLELMNPGFSNLNNIFRSLSHGWQSSSQSVMAVYNSSRAISSHIDELAGKMSDGKELLQKNIEMMGMISLSVKKIHYILEVIAEISEETNMLSINGAIEAFHAGESGVGFSVVAEEIRQVALLTVKEAETIEKVINHVDELSMQDVETVKSIDGIFTEFSRNIEKLFIYVLNVTSTAQDMKSKMELLSKSDKLWPENTMQDSVKKIIHNIENEFIVCNGLEFSQVKPVVQNNQSICLKMESILQKAEGLAKKI